MDNGLFYSLVVFVLINLIDYIQTHYALKTSKFRELNPLADLIYRSMGTSGLISFKLLVSGLMIMIITLFKNFDVEGSIWLWNIILGFVTAWNSIQLFIYKKFTRNESK
ncbi:MAG: DUF5658 family protein [Desulfurococcaceae archaeon]